MRTDCIRDNRRVNLHHLPYPLGCAVWYVKRGFWFEYQDESTRRVARSLGRVSADGKEFIEAIVMFGSDMSPTYRWVEPKHVVECHKTTPREKLCFMMGPWKQADVIARVERGFLPQEFVSRAKNA